MRISHALPLLCLVWLLGWGMAGPAQAQSAGERFSGPPPSSGQAQNLARELVQAQRREPTNASNVMPRHQQLGQVLSQLMAGGQARLVDQVLSKADSQAVERQMQGGDPERAAHLLAAAIDRLERLLEDGALATAPGRPGPPPRERGQMASGGYPLPERGQGQDAAPGRGFRDQGPPPGMAAREPYPAAPAPAQAPQPVTPPTRRFNLGDLRQGPGFSPVLKLANPVLDQARGKLYVTGFLSTHLAVVDLASRRLERSVEMGVTGGFLLPDPTDGGLYLFDIGLKRYFRLDPLRGGSQPLAALPGHLRLPARGTGKSYGQRMFLESGFPFRPGFLQDSNAAYNVIKVADAQGREQGQILHGPDALYFDIDQTRGLLYGSNTGDASLSVFDLTDGNRWQGDIKVGASVEELAWDPAGQALYIRNRLGGSQICRWQPDLGQAQVLGNENELQRGGLGMWPAGMGLYQDQFYVMSHYAGRLDVFNAARASWIKSIDLGLPRKPRTDAISQMVLDARRGRLYAAFPELGLVTGLDLNSETRLGNVSIPLSGQVSGPFHLLLEVSQATGRLYVFVPSQGQLQVHEGGSLALLHQASLPPCERERLTMRLDDVNGLLYLGDHVLDSGSLTRRGRLEPGQRVAQVDPEGGRLYVARVTRLSPVQVQEELTEYLDGQPGRSWIFSPVARLPLSYAFDWAGGRFFVGYFETAQVEEHPL